MKYFSRLCIFFVVIFMITDFLTRMLHYENEEGIKVPQSNDLKEIVWPWQLEKYDVLKHYTKYEIVESNEPVVDNPEPARASSNSSVYENTKIELKAVWKSSESYALLRITDMTEQTSRLKKVKEGEVILGLSLNIISQIKVSLSANEKEIMLVMYEPQKEENI